MDFTQTSFSSRPVSTMGPVEFLFSAIQGRTQDFSGGGRCQNQMSDLGDPNSIFLPFIPKVLPLVGLLEQSNDEKDKCLVKGFRRFWVFQTGLPSPVTVIPQKSLVQEALGRPSWIAYLRHCLCVPSNFHATFYFLPLGIRTFILGFSSIKGWICQEIDWSSIPTLPFSILPISRQEEHIV